MTRKAITATGWAAIWIQIAALTLVCAPTAAAQTKVVCTFSDSRFTEISGLATSIQHPHTLWLHNDSSGGPVIYAVDSQTCATRATIKITGAKGRDFESISTGSDKQGRPVIWLGDIGDNRDSWPYVEVLRIREPARLASQMVRVKTYRFTYRDRPHNAEALLADPSGPRLWVVTKQLAHGSLYALPDPLRPHVLNIASKLRVEGGLITDGAISPDGTKYVLRDYVNAVVYSGLPPGREVARIVLPYQFQGEAITWTSDSRALLIASERDDRLLTVNVP
ncbi:MAG: hypothetical protein EXQ60_08090 [Candidatus Nanopelagicales bacterium]|nr:hypothetical protein [Candidatus Nanopelagicales bacterium]